ncbi:MAG: hypothetical protein DRH11_02580 [Deltaproteobacteria bacterium]|nr:MAG: hypothetical protein DRH11_02580 [Deltaproteobacteria bacterium]
MARGGNARDKTKGPEAKRALVARSAALGAIYNVKINLQSIQDEEFVKSLMEHAQRIEKEVGLREEKVLAKVGF